MQNELNQTGRIFDIQRFSVHDGPGVRTIVFLKGCLLRCRWCCNPESQNYKIEEMALPEGGSKTVGRDVTVGEVLAEVQKDAVYYRRSGGGATLSGGECLCQADFAYALLKTFKENSINTAIETTLCADYDVIQRIIPYTDTFLVDVKHTNFEKHKEFTTRSNELMLDNLRRLSKEGKHIIVRVPTIPTFNATAEEIRSIAQFVRSLETVDEMHLLPYHNFGSDKYKNLGRDYLMKDIQTPTDDYMQMLKEVVISEGIECQIGG